MLRTANFTLDWDSSVRTAVSSLLWACANSRSIQSLSLSGLSLDPESFQALSFMLRNSRALYIYILDLDTILDRNAFNQVLDAVNTSQSLVHCRIPVDFPQFELVELINSIKHHRTLQKFEVERISDAEPRAFFETYPIHDEKRALQGSLAVASVVHTIDHRNQIIQNEAYVDLDVRNLIFDARFFCGLRFMKARGGERQRQIPIELIERILFLAHYDDKICYEDQLKVIIRCLLDRRTLGKIIHDEITPSKNFIYVRCRHIVESFNN